ncbi:MAG: molybdopterin-guanine dinucleotide biosynthesis protein B [Candidatus Bathyarchaeota archaeon]|nr:molybdopterin-guanine dinucleotide biosynthesis protein B [Candidatus Bathyarchaeota archaeon]
MVKVVAVVGGKHSGKTTVIEHLIAELKRRGFSVGAVKEMVRIPTLDTPATETDRYAQAGAEIIVAVPRVETVVFIKKRLTLAEVVPYLQGLDYAVLEGFESEQGVPKIVAAKTVEEARAYQDGSTIAISGIITDSPDQITKASELSVILLNSIRQTAMLADVVEQKAAAYT